MSSATLFSVALLAELGGMSRALLIFLPEDPGTTLVTELDGPRDFFTPKPGELEQRLDLASSPSSFHSNKFSIYRDLKDDNSFSVTSKRSMRRKHFLQRTRGPTDRFSSTPNKEEILEQILNFSAVSDVRL